MSGTVFVCNTPIDLNADASVFTGNIASVMREYTIEISVPQSTFFATRTYVDSVDNVTVDLTTNEELRGYSATLVKNDLVNGTGIESGDARNVGQRLVEILAIKLFGNAKARAALANETSIANTSVIVNTALFTDRFDIFNEYAALDRTDNENNVDGVKQFSFIGDVFEFHLRLSSTVSGTDGTQQAGAQNGNYIVPGAVVGTLLGNEATKFDTSTRQLTNCPITLRVTITA